MEEKNYDKDKGFDGSYETLKEYKLMPKSKNELESLFDKKVP